MRDYVDASVPVSLLAADEHTTRAEPHFRRQPLSLVVSDFATAEGLVGSGPPFLHQRRTKLGTYEAIITMANPTPMVRTELSRLTRRPMCFAPVAFPLSLGQRAQCCCSYVVFTM